ncbi:hypothetical protein TNCV_928791 [Trichonephila clavipes]|nr:hypothetical protein TNCV_928791 [Trichonephila clavipes]
MLNWKEKHAQDVKRHFATQIEGLTCRCQNSSSDLNILRTLVALGTCFPTSRNVPTQKSESVEKISEPAPPTTCTGFLTEIPICFEPRRIGWQKRMILIGGDIRATCILLFIGYY